MVVVVLVHIATAEKTTSAAGEAEAGQFARQYTSRIECIHCCQCRTNYRAHPLGIIAQRMNIKRGQKVCSSRARRYQGDYH